MKFVVFFFCQSKFKIGQVTPILKLKILIILKFETNITLWFKINLFLTLISIIINLVRLKYFNVLDQCVI